MKPTMQTLGWFAQLAALLFLAAGCGCSHKMAPRDVNVTLDESLIDPQGKMASVLVNIIAVNDAEYPRWYSVSVDEYFAGHPLASTPDRFEMKFRQDRTTETLPATDPIWSKWQAKGAIHLVLMAFIPGLSGSAEGARDPRRIIVTLDPCQWNDLGPIRIRAGKSGLLLLTPPKPK